MLNPSPPDVDTRFPPRTQVPKYKDGETNNGSRSLTIVRLDTGEVVRTFRAKKDKAGKLKDKGKVIEVRYRLTDHWRPGGVPRYHGLGLRTASSWATRKARCGAWISRRPNPDNWTMKLFFDAYSGQSCDAGQPIQTAPVRLGGREGQRDASPSPPAIRTCCSATTGQKNFVFSLTERLNLAATAYESNANWFVPFDDAERVTGPMTLFNGALYFTSYKPEPPSSGSACWPG